MIKETDTYYLNINEPNKSTLLALRNIILNQDKEIIEFLKYKIPCFKYRSKVFCYLWIDKESNEPCLLMQDGKQLNHPGLEKTNHKQIELFRINPNEDLPIKRIISILTKGLELFK
ncbi:DUF1801 domain-containing protein [Flavivirga spongiicola]|uniref:DUF1801 domain-containing protein n=1 Tax=Flavivirga spongiicola TaxID=421621 RepID=A0ABU7XLA3_9FLAO|nr:DUF1801 domain-containing protein [Flavivirga sp. MEBiC05379]MDO5981208.1 DUF1801 domain-containing protein [Flavivirga sp. MEBiC05379]